MAKRIFISFAIEDSNLRDFLVGQARNNNSPFDFVDMSVKSPWDSEWKTKCRTKIRGCDGIIIIVTQNTKKADGQIWEVMCAIQEGIPGIGLWGHNDEKVSPLPSIFVSVKVVNWSWSNIKSFIDGL